MSARTQAEWRDPPVSVVGNLTTDLIIHGVETLPRWGRETSGQGHRTTASGQAAYLAFGLAGLGMASNVVGVVGDDPEGAAIHSALADAGVGTDTVETTSAAPTAITVAVVRPDGERAFVSDFACQRLVDLRFLERHWSAIAAGRAICLVGLFNLPKLPPNAAVPLFARARAAGLLTVLDTGWDPSGWQPSTIAGAQRLLAETDLFLPNIEEAEALTGERDPDAAALALQLLGVRTVVVKCGPHGSAGVDDGHRERIPALSVPVHDAVGAGDSFDAGFLYAYLQGQNLRKSMEFATATAAIYVSRAHDRYPTAADVHSILSNPTHRADTPPHTAAGLEGDAA